MRQVQRIRGTPTGKSQLQAEDYWFYSGEKATNVVFDHSKVLSVGGSKLFLGERLIASRGELAKNLFNEFGHPVEVRPSGRWLFRSGKTEIEVTIVNGDTIEGFTISAGRALANGEKQ